jgi:hypothetical protein
LKWLWPDVSAKLAELERWRSRDETLAAEERLSRAVRSNQRQFQTVGDDDVPAVEYQCSDPWTDGQR